MLQMKATVFLVSFIFPPISLGRKKHITNEDIWIFWGMRWYILAWCRGACRKILVGCAGTLHLLRWVRWYTSQQISTVFIIYSHVQRCGMGKNSKCKHFFNTLYNRFCHLPYLIIILPIWATLEPI